MKPLLEVRNLSKSYRRSQGMLRHKKVVALNDVSFTLYEQQTLAIVGEAGSGKSTLARILAGAERPDKGQLLLDNTPLEDDIATKRHSTRAGPSAGSWMSRCD